MHFALVIPTYRRIQKLTRCVTSILGQTHQDFTIYIMADNDDKETFSYVEEHYEGNDKVVPILVSDHLYGPGCWNLFTRDYFDCIKDGMAWIVDDVEFYPNCLEEANKTAQNIFGEGRDLVVGFAQECPGHPEYTYKIHGAVVLGRDFIKRYPERQVCCPDYIYFHQDEEMWVYATSLGVFELCPTAVLKHYHPAFIKSEKDETHRIPRRKTYVKDFVTYKNRKHRELVWGKSWELIN